VGAAGKIEPWLERLHVVLIGPGLGREAATFKVSNRC
jgi:NAD(P)H-hydrate repair Nnr-like enzyme with NAD(P)H-hydrate dehydratase domain